MSLQDRHIRKTARNPTHEEAFTSQHSQQLITDGGSTILKGRCSFSEVVDTILHTGEADEIGVNEEFLMEGRTVLMTVCAWPIEQSKIKEICAEITQVRISGRVFDLHLELDPYPLHFMCRVPVYAKDVPSDPDFHERFPMCEGYPQTDEEGVALVQEVVRDAHELGDPTDLYRGDQFHLEGTLVEVTDSRPCRHQREALGDFKLCPVEALETRVEGRVGTWVCADQLTTWRDEGLLSDPPTSTESDE